MKFYGFQKTTLIDYPKHIASVLFTNGCNMRCPFCHNPDLVLDSETDPIIDEDGFFEYAKKRKGILEAVSITGGEPLLYGNDLFKFIEKVKWHGLKVKVDTNGLFPDLIDYLEVDYIAMDVKTSLAKYESELGAVQGAGELILESIEKIISRGDVVHEFRTTVVPGIVTHDDIKEIVSLLSGAKNYVLSQFRPMLTLDPSFENVTPYDTEELKKMQAYCIEQGLPTTLRANYN